MFTKTRFASEKNLLEITCLIEKLINLQNRIETLNLYIKSDASKQYQKREKIMTMTVVLYDPNI